jgi:hypothetical protein
MISSESAGNVILRSLITGRSEDFVGLVEFDHPAQQKERREIRHARRLLQIMRDDDDGVSLAQVDAPPACQRPFFLLAMIN